MENKSNTLLKVTGILMIIGGALSAILLIFAGGLGLFASAAGVLGQGSGLLLFATVLLLIGAVVELIAGIVGVKNAAKPEKAGVCIVFGIIVFGLSLLGNIMNLIGESGFNFSSLLLGLLLPALYLVGAFQNKAKA